MTIFLSNRTTFALGLTFTLLAAFYFYQFQDTFSVTMSSTNPNSSNDVPGLEFEFFTMTQNQNRPSLLVTLRNTHPDTPYTILSWGTPFDPAALNTGIFTLVDNETGNEVEQVILQINRMSPSRNDLITIAPRIEETIEVVFDKPWMPEKKLAKYTVKAEGSFTGAWKKHKSDVTQDELDDYLNSPLNGKRFTTNEAVLEVN